MKTGEWKYRKIAIKVGSNVITCEDGSLNVGRMLRLVEDISVLSKQGLEVILISSGAVAAGRSSVVPAKRTNIVSAKQIWAAIGQVKLMSTYQFLFEKYNIVAGQVLATKEEFSDRRHYLNMKNCISSMLENKVLPVVNENDTVAINELMFTDNDELSGMIASMMDSEALFLLSNVDGIYNGIPGNAGVEIISEVVEGTVNPEQFITKGKSGFGRGGMLTKYATARKIASEGVDVFIANGNRDSIVLDILRGRDVPFTRIRRCNDRPKSVKKWLYHSDTFARGAVVVNRGAKDALLADRASSLLMVGITGVEGYFEKGDIVRIVDEEGNSIGLGKTAYDSRKAEQSIGTRLPRPFIHYHYLVLNEELKNGFSS